MTDITVSEKTFEQFCKDNSIPYSRISREKERTPDYNVYFGKHHIIAEVKQTDQNVKDVALHEQLKSRGTASGWEESGRRVRIKIDNAKKQLKFTQGPAILVLFDNVPIGSIDADDIRTAMYGHETIKLSIPQGDKRMPIDTINVGFGGGRKFTEDHNTSFSAIAFLYKFAGSLHLSIFHNIHAKHPIDPSWLRRDTVRHFTLGAKFPGTFQEWQEI